MKMPIGVLKSPGLNPFADHIARSVPSGPKISTRLFRLSVNQILPAESTAANGSV